MQTKGICIDIEILILKHHLTFPN